MKLAKMLAVACIIGLVGYVIAADAPATKPAHVKKLRGQITKIDGASITVKTHARKNAESKEVVVVTDDKTVVTIDKVAAKVADLKVDMYVTVTPAEGTAEKIEASTKAPESRPTSKPTE